MTSLLSQLAAAYAEAKEEYDKLIKEDKWTEFKAHDSFMAGEEEPTKAGNEGKIKGKEAAVKDEEKPAKAGKEAAKSGNKDEIEDGLIALGDNLEYMKYLLKKKNMAGKIQLIYIDPPFFTKEKFLSSIRLESEKLGKSEVIKIGAYDDNQKQSMEFYLKNLALRLMYMRELLSDSGIIWLHLDRHVVHYAKVLMDEIFGEKNFINEIIWTYKSGGASSKSFARKHDNILVYSKGSKYKFNILKEKSYNRGYKPYHFKGVEEFCDDLGWYTLVNMKDVWQIDMVGRTSSERRGYATQKPEKLMERIISSCSQEGDICADFYGGSGAFACTCKKLGRRFITGDENPGACVSQIEALAKNNAQFNVISQGDWPCGKVSLSGDKIIDYEVDLKNVTSSNGECLKKYLEQDGGSFVKICRKITLNNKEYITGYDILGNYFKTEITDG